MGSGKSKYIPDTNFNQGVWRDINFPPIIAVYDNVNIEFTEIGKNKYVYDLNAVINLFSGFNIRRIINVEKQIIEASSGIVHTGSWYSSDDAYNSRNTAIAVLYLSKNNMIGGDLLIDAEFRHSSPVFLFDPDPPRKVAKIEVVPNRCVVLRGDIRYKISDWRRLDPKFPSYREAIIIIAEI